MKLSHGIFIRVFQEKNNFDLNEFINALDLFLPQDLIAILNLDSGKEIKEKLLIEKCDLSIQEITSKDALKVSSSKAEIIDGLDLIRIDFSCLKEKHINYFLEKLKENLKTPQCDLIKSQENRIDDDCNLFIRLDKNELKNKNVLLTDNGNCFHIRIKLAAYPNKKENAFKLIQEIF